jgi:uncharacterized membrane protein YedE/YeeE
MVFETADVLAGLAGGLMIGLAAAIFLLGVGRIAGISGIAGSALRPWGRLEWGEDLAFLAGLVVTPLVLAAIVGAPKIGVDSTPLLVIAGGLLVGYGTRMGSGCTSGHGVCGVTRLSPRSLAATGVFMAVGVLAATLLRPMLAGG